MKKCFKYLLLIISTMGFTVALTGQSQYLGITISNNTTGLPIIEYPELFYTKFHPGFEISYQRKINKGEKNLLFLNANLGFYHHQFVQSLLKFYPSVNYEREISKRFSFNGGIGGGYGLSFEGKNAFKIGENGEYVNKPFFGARSQYLFSLELGMLYDISKTEEGNTSLVVHFKSLMQGTYVKSYVPLLPINSINIGIRFTL